MSSYIKRMENYSQKISSFFENNYIRKLFFFASILIVFALIYLLNYLHPLFGDDWMYGVNANGRITTFLEILEAQYKHYFDWGGRTIVHIIAQSLILLGSPWDDLLNSIAFVAYILVIYYLANNGERKFSSTILLGIGLLVWFFQREFASTTLWMTGSANYLWGTLIIISFLTPYYLLVLKGKTKDNYIKCILFFFLGIIAGWTNENTSVGFIFILISILVYHKREAGSLPKWSVSGVIGVITGCAIMLLAPGNQARSEYLRTHENKITNVLSIDSLFDGIIRSFFGFYHNSLPLTFILIFALILFFVYGKQGIKQRVIFLSFTCLAGAIIATLAMAASPIFPDRASFGLNTFIIIAIVTLYANMDVKIIKQLGRLTVVFAILIFAMDYFSAYKELSGVHKAFSKRIEIIEEGKKKGIRNFVIKDSEIISRSRYLHYWELSSTPSDSPNKWFSPYYEIDSVILEKE